MIITPGFQNNIPLGLIGVKKTRFEGENVMFAMCRKKLRWGPDIRVGWGTTYTQFLGFLQCNDQDRLCVGWLFIVAVIRRKRDVKDSSNPIQDLMQW